MCITCIATPRQFELINEHEVTSTRHVKDRTQDLGPLLIQWKLIVKPDLVKWLVRRSEGLVDLQCSEEVRRGCEQMGKQTHVTEHLAVFKHQEGFRVQNAVRGMTCNL